MNSLDIDLGNDTSIRHWQRECFRGRTAVGKFHPEPRGPRCRVPRL